MVMGPDKMQLQRLELKYKINEDMALRLRDFVSSYLELDEYSVGRPNYSYPIHSLYLDSNDLKLYWDTINGDKNRFKLRLRYYDEEPESPVFFEIKRRMNNCILKQRGGVKREAVAHLLSGHLPSPEHLISENPKPRTAYLVALQRFCQYMMRLGAVPKAHIAYLREAWVSHNDNSVRVTFDRGVRCRLDFTTQLSTQMQDSALVFGNELVLEIKFTNRFPLWLEDMIRCFSLRVTGAAKYVEGVEIVGEHRFYQSSPFSMNYLTVPSVEEEPVTIPIELVAKAQELQRIS
jgi:SPX domain protein involved in polyphosphate accumulation